MVRARVLGADDVAVLVARVGLDEFADELLARLVAALEEHTPELVQTHDRSGFHYDKPDLGLLEWMPAMEVGRRVAIKTVGYHPTNPVQRGAPSVLATTSLYDTTSGELLLVAEASLLTALRTGAASAIATDVLAPDGPVRLGVVGCGAQAVTQVHLLSRVRELEQVLVTDTVAANAASLVDRLAFLDVPVEVRDPADLEALVAEVDVLCTCTSVPPGEGPVIPDAEHRPHLHVNAVGADFPGKHEVPAPLLRRAVVVPDVVSQCLLEGESQQLEATELGPDLAELVRDRAQHESHRSRLTVFDSTGWSLEDLVAVELVLDLAEEHQVGAVVDLQPDGDDPYDPYGPFRPGR